ncbi:MAG: hypothetical protein HKO98_01600 [Gemmatimonadetes bacterium]|nr:hypothetical protein [Gemmatimonadota bacterium]
MTEVARWIVLAFGGFLVATGGLMLFAPERARGFIRKAGSTNRINYSEITLRLIPAAALVLAADVSRFPTAFRILGTFMIVTSLVLYFVPRRMHHAYAVYWADALEPRYMRLVAPFSVAFGVAVILAVLAPAGT